MESPRFIGPWDKNFHVRPELTQDEIIDILNNTTTTKYIPKQQQLNNIKEQREKFEIQQ